MEHAWHSLLTLKGQECIERVLETRTNAKTYCNTRLLICNGHDNYITPKFILLRINYYTSYSEPPAIAIAICVSGMAIIVCV